MNVGVESNVIEYVWGVASVYRTDRHKSINKHQDRKFISIVIALKYHFFFFFINYHDELQLRRFVFLSLLFNGWMDAEKVNNWEIEVEAQKEEKRKIKGDE